MDTSRIQGLLEQAGASYNQGQYAEAIAVWQEVLRLDPDNQKAREGIRMAKLLVVNWDSAQGGEGGEELGIEPAGADPETRQKIEFGITRIRELLEAGRHKEASEGCQLLAELAPGMPAVIRLQEEIAHAAETRPFVEEHLGRARKLLAAEKVAEAVEEARKVLSVDPGNEEARAIAGHGAAASGKAAPAASAFRWEGEAAPPSPFAGSASAEDLAAHIGLDTAPPQGQEMPLEMGFEEVESGAPARPGAGTAEVASLLEQGKRLFGQKRYQDAIDAWSRIYAIDASNDEANQLIDQASARIAEIGSRVEQAMYQAQDQLGAGNFAGAKKAFGEVLALQPGNREALDQIARIDETLGSVDDLGDSIPMAEPVPEPGAAPPAKPSAPAAPIPPRSAAQAASRSGAPPAVRLAEPSREAPMSAGLPKRKPVVPVRPPRKGPGASLAFILLGVVAVGAGAGWWFLMGPGAEPPPPLDPGSLDAAPSLPGTKPPERPDPVPPDPPKAAAGGGAPAPAVARAAAPPPAPLDPAARERQVQSLVREGRALLQKQQYGEAQARFVEALRLDPTNFDAEDLRMQAASGVAEETSFNRDLESAKGAFADQDWGSSLYKLYRLQQEHEDMKILARYIANANYNWGVQSMEAFQLDDARQHFNDALEQAPADRTIRQHLEVIERYGQRRRDAAFDAYVGKVKLRALDAG